MTAFGIIFVLSFANNIRIYNVYVEFLCEERLKEKVNLQSHNAMAQVFNIDWLRQQLVLNPLSRYRLYVQSNNENLVTNNTASTAFVHAGN